MPPITLKEVISYSSEDANHPARNLLKPESFLKWKCSSECTDRQSYVILKLEKLSIIHSINIGNENSGMVEILAGREGTDFQVLLVSSSFMTPLESRNSTNINRVRMFGPDKLNANIAAQEWDRIKIVCTQLYNKTVQYGLSFIHLQSNEREKDNIPDSDDLPNSIKLGRFTLKESNLDNTCIPVGSLFAQIKETESSSSAAAIRAASKAAVSLKLPNSQDSEKNATSNKRKLSNNGEIDSDIGFYQLKKNIKERSSPVPLKKEESHRHIPQSKSKLSPVINEKVKLSPVPQKKGLLTVSHKNIENKKRPEIEGAVMKVQNRNLSAGDTSNKNLHQYKPFKKLMDNVIFVMSGYQNPKRSQLRDKLLEMGAKYKGDWDKTCTHLICAYVNTPKFHAVKGKGKILSEKWVDDCYQKKIRLPWRRYNLEKDRADESEDEIFASELLPKQDHSDVSTKNYEEPGGMGNLTGDDSEDTDDEIGKVISSKVDLKKPIGNGSKSNILNSDDEYDADTDIDEDIPVVINRIDTSNLPLPVLLDFFQGKSFHLYGFISKTKEKSILRYITAYGGKLSNYMNKTVNYVITESPWDDNFDDALAENPSLHFVKPQWIWKCCNKQKFVPPQPFLVSCIES